MKLSPFHFFTLTLAAYFFISCNNSPSATEKDTDFNSPAGQLKEENITYRGDSINMNGYVVYNDSIKGIRPAVLVVHEWWGLNDYSKKRARKLANLGYIAMAVDMYGNGDTATTPEQAMKLASPFYSDPQMAKTRLDAAIAKLKSYPQTDTNNIAAIGYCYGGYIVLNAAKLGSPLIAVVSFHGDLSGVVPDKNLLKAKILVCHGDSDTYVPPAVVAKFKKQMDSVGADYAFKSYPNATHAFTNPAATELGKKFNMHIAYNAEADKNSWKDMKDFFNRVFK